MDLRDNNEKHSEHEGIYGPEPKDMIVVHEDDDYKFYAYRPRDLLVAGDVAATVRAELGRLLGPVTPTGGVGTMVKYCVPALMPVDGLLAHLRSVLPDTHRSSVSLNTVVSVGCNYRYCCPHPPQPVAKPEFEKLADPTAGSGIRVATIDTGVAVLAEDMERQIERQADDRDHGYDMPDEDPKSSTLQHGGGHGTFAAGLILQNAPQAKVVSLRRVDVDGLIDDWQLAEALVEVSTLGVDIVSLSLGGPTPDDMGLPATAEALRILFERHPGVVVVCAAGNHTTRRASYPAAYKQVIAVGALDRNQDPAWFTSRGCWVDACAPGIDVISTFLNKRDFGNRSLSVHRLQDAGPQFFEGWASWSGTSFAAPQVAGAIAARMSAGSTNELAFMGGQSLPQLAETYGPTSVPELGTRVATRVVLKPLPA